MKEKLPKERREQGIYRLKKMVVEIQGHQDCMSYPSDQPLLAVTDYLYRPSSH